MKPPIFRPAAAADVEDAYGWYEDQRAGLGDEFLAAVTTTLESLITTLNGSPLFIARRIV